MFRHRYRRRPFAPYINWTDYRWDPAPRPVGPVRGPWGRPRRHGLAPVILAGLAVLLGLKVFSAYRNHRGSWLGKAALGAIVLMLIAAFSSQRSRRNYW
jgi:hypothetical protein